jgi:hypothetical protein
MSADSRRYWAEDRLFTKSNAHFCDVWRDVHSAPWCLVSAAQLGISLVITEAITNTGGETNIRPQEAMSHLCDAWLAQASTMVTRVSNLSLVPRLRLNFGGVEVPY